MQIIFLPIFLMSVENFVEKARFYMLSASQWSVLASADLQENWGLIPSNRASVSRYTKNSKIVSRCTKKGTLRFEYPYFCEFGFRLWEKVEIVLTSSERCSGYSQRMLLRHTLRHGCMPHMPGRYLARC